MAPILLRQHLAQRGQPGLADRRVLGQLIQRAHAFAQTPYAGRGLAGGQAGAAGQFQQVRAGGCPPSLETTFGPLRQKWVLRGEAMQLH